MATTMPFASTGRRVIGDFVQHEESDGRVIYNAHPSIPPSTIHRAAPPPIATLAQPSQPALSSHSAVVFQKTDLSNQYVGDELDEEDEEDESDEDGPPLRKKRKTTSGSATTNGRGKAHNPRGGTGRSKIAIEYIVDRKRRQVTFAKRKAGIMKKAYELSTLTGTQVLLLVVSETGLVYTFTSGKLQPMVTQPEGKNLIQACLNA